MRNFLAVMLCFVLNQVSCADHGISVRGTPKYSQGFKHFAHANPSAPQGGELVIGVLGTFDSLNPYIVAGTAAAGIADLTVPRLMVRSPDETFTIYNWVSKDVQVGPDRSWLIFELREDAKWEDGTPITADDVIFTREIFLKDGRPNLKAFYSKTEKMERLGARKLKITFKKQEAPDPELPMISAFMPLLQKAYFEKHAFDKVSLDKWVSGGPYRIAKVDPGRSITYERVPNYWGNELPVIKGLFNFKTIRYEYYRDEAALFEAFKAGKIDVVEEKNIQKWQEAYDFPAVREKKVKKVEWAHTRPVGITALVFNTRRPIFENQKVRRALMHAFDFEWMNKTFYRGKQQRTQSFFDNTELAAKGLPTGLEKAILDTFKDKLPKDIFVKPYTLPKTKGNGDIRANTHAALALLKEAGWVLKAGKLVNEKTGAPFTFEILMGDKKYEKEVLSFVRNLKHLGIEARVRLVDSAQFTERMNAYEYDMTIYSWWNSKSPGHEMSFYWSSKSADTPGTRNYMGVKDPVLDELARLIPLSPDEKTLYAHAQAFDRVLLSGDYVIPMGHSAVDRLAYWDKIDGPAFVTDLNPWYLAWWSKGAKHAGKSR